MIHKKESDVAAVVISHFKKLGYNIHPEHGNWDIVAAKPKPRNGYPNIVGIETKIFHNKKAYTQAATRVGVHYKVVAAQKGKWDPTKIGYDRRIIVMNVDDQTCTRDHMNPMNHYKHNPDVPLWLPTFFRTVRAGVAAPTAVSKAAAAALEFEKVMQGRGLTREELYTHPDLQPYLKWLPEFIAAYASFSHFRYYLQGLGNKLPSMSNNIYLKAGLNRFRAREYTGNLTEGQYIANQLRKKREASE